MQDDLPAEKPRKIDYATPAARTWPFRALVILGMIVVVVLVTFALLPHFSHPRSLMNQAKTFPATYPTTAPAIVSPK